MELPPDRRPGDPVDPRRPIVREEVVQTPIVDPLRVEVLEDRVSSLKGLLALASLLALCALALAGWAILRDDDTDAGPSNSRVSKIDAKVDRLERQISGAPADAADADQVEDGLADKADAADLERLRRQVSELRSAAADAPAAAPEDDANAQAVTALDERLKELEDQVDQLAAKEQQQSP